VIRAWLTGLTVCLALVLSSTAGAQDTSATQGVAASADPYAPLDQARWTQMLAGYRQLADCEDRYMTAAGLNGLELGKRLAALGKTGEVKEQTLKLIDPESPWRKSLTAEGAKDADVVAQALMALMMDGNQDGRTRMQTMTRIGYARYYTALATQDTCKPDPQFVELLKQSSP
jgi:hypothetical protein